MGWNYKTDTLHQEHSDLVKYAQSLTATKRSVLKLSAKIFDPIYWFDMITLLTIHEGSVSYIMFIRLRLGGRIDARLSDLVESRIYLCTEHANGDIEVNLVASKARVAPIERQSLPRLELFGVTILARLMRTIENSLVHVFEGRGPGGSRPVQSMQMHRSKLRNYKN